MTLSDEPRTFTSRIYVEYLKKGYVCGPLSAQKKQYTVLEIKYYFPYIVQTLMLFVAP